MQRTLTHRHARGPFHLIAGGLLGALALTILPGAVPLCAGQEMQLDAGRRSSAKRIPRAMGASLPKPAWTTETTGGFLLRAGRGREAPVAHVNGRLYTQPPGSVASPTGSTYSVHHRVGAVVDDGGGPAHTCFDISNTSDPADYIVSFDGVSETLREDIFRTAASVIESDTPQEDGSRIIRVTTTAPQGTDLFPGGVFGDSVELTDACFSIGLDDPLSWEGLDTVVQADVTFLTDGAVGHQADITPLFSAPWDGVVDVVLEDGAGQGYNGVRLVIKTEKDIVPANDQCDARIEVSDGFHSFSTIGATTDGNEEFPECSFGGFADIAADIWFQYTATCTGDLIVDLCDSSYDTKVAVYNGCGRCPPENPIACNDDWCGLQSSLGPDGGRDRVPVVAESCYTLRVGGVQGLSGSGNGLLFIECRDESDVSAACCLAGDCTEKREAECVDQKGTWFAGQTCDGFVCLTPPPSNDECPSCIPLTTGVPFDGTTVGSTGTDQSTCGLNDTNDVWHCWTADCEGVPVFETCGSQFDTTLSIYDGCEGGELRCTDDGGCSSSNLTSKISNLFVTEGETFSLRVSGHKGDTGSYRLLVTGCRSACCLTDPAPDCGLATREDCESLGGASLIGQVCSGDGDGDEVDDTCAGCPPEVRISNSDPFTATVDARRPFDQTTPLQREGIGTTSEPVRLLLSPGTNGLEGCFFLCETAADPDLGGNDIAAASRLPNGLYQLRLDHAIPAGASTTIQYLGDGSFVRLFAHPGNVNGDGIADWMDVYSLMDCCLEDSCATWGNRSCDVDRSGARAPQDILTTIDLLLGAGSWNAWDQTLKPSSAGCP